MSEIWFISDTHLGHKNILAYEPDARPFKTIEEMNETIITNWNNTVGKNDTVYHLGDFAFGRANVELADRLHGHKKLCLGNHDTYPSSLYLRFFEKLYGCFFWERCVLTHMPVHSNGLGSRWLLNVHGHLHSKRVRIKTITMLHEDGANTYTVEDDPNYFNVSVEQHNLTPINADVIRARVKELE